MAENHLLGPELVNSAETTADLLAGSEQVEVDAGSGATPLRQLDPRLSKQEVLSF
jgi:hypothetical protein